MAFKLLSQVQRLIQKLHREIFIYFKTVLQIKEVGKNPYFPITSEPQFNFQTLIQKYNFIIV